MTVFDDPSGWLAALSPNRPIEEVAAECDETFAAYSRTDVQVTVSATPLRTAIDAAIKKNRTSCVIIPPHFFKVEPGPLLGRLLRLCEMIEKKEYPKI